MISDVLSEAIEQIRDYLTNPVYAGVYGEPAEPFRQRIEKLVAEMDEVREILDTPPVDEKHAH
jgi:hypothetical protein